VIAVFANLFTSQDIGVSPKKAIVANFSEYYKKYSDLIVFLEELDYKKI